MKYSFHIHFSVRHSIILLFLFMIFFSSALIFANAEEENKSAKTQAMLEQLYARNKELDDENKVYEKKMLDFVTQVTEKEKQLDVLGKKLAAAMDEMKALKSKEEKGDAELSQLKKVNDQAKDRELEIEKLKSEVKKATEELTIIQLAQETAKNEKEELQKRLDAIQAEREGLAKSSDSAKQSLEAVLKEKEVLIEENAQIQKKLEQAEKLQKTIEDLKRERELIMTQTDQVQQRLNAVEEEKKTSQTEMDALMKTAEEAKKTATATAQERDQILKKNEDLQKALDDLDKEKKAALQERDALKAEMENLKKKTEAMQTMDANTENEEIKGAKSSMEEMKLRAAALEKNLTQREDKIKVLESSQKSNLEKISELEKRISGIKEGDMDSAKQLVGVSAPKMVSPSQSTVADQASKSSRQDYGTLSKTVRRPLSDRVSPWKNPGFRDDQEIVTNGEHASDRRIDGGEDLDDSSQIEKTQDKDTQYELKLLREKTQNLESDLGRRDRQLRELNQEIDDRLQKMQDEKERLEAVINEQKEELQDMQIKNAATGVKRSLMRPQHKVSSDTKKVSAEDPKIENLEKKAEGLRKRAIQDRENYFYNLGVVLMRLGNFKQAARMLEKAVELDPADTSAHYNLGILYDDHLEEPRKAIRHYQAFLDLSHDTEKVRDVAKWLQITESYGGTGGRKSRVQSAREAFEHLFLTNSY